MDKEVFLSKLQSLSTPLIRLCVQHGIKLGELVDALKRSYIRIAEETLSKTGEAVSTSRITIMTGVHRTDVAAIREEGSFAPRPRHTASDVIGLWRFEKRFSTRPGTARTLTVEGKHSEFADLVKSVSLSLSPYTVLFELERLGLVKKTTDGKVKLLSRMFVTKGDSAAALDMLAEDAEDLFLAIDENAFAPENSDTPHHHIKTEYSNVPDEHIAEIKCWFLKQGSSFHEKARQYLSKFDRDIHKNVKGSNSNRVAVVSYSFVSPADSTNSDKQDQKKEG
jgi:hypothetical protein